MEIQKNCKCGKKHIFTSQVIVKEGALQELTELLAQYGAKKVFLIADKNTYAAAGKAVTDIIAGNVLVASCIFNEDALEPDERSVGRAVMYYESDCDVVIGVGSGVINDIGKIVANVAGKPYIIVGTAPSMDGYASATSSMTRDGLKISLPSKCADVIVGDLDVLCEAPLHMIRAGIGDTLAKYISICEWKIANLVIGEYYCPVVAEMVQTALQRCLEASSAALRREPEGVKAVMEGMIITGMAMQYAGVSRPASGVEHYFSHIWDMRGLAFGAKTDLHGIQCGIGTLLSLKVYEYIRTVTPDREHALAQVAAFDEDVWDRKLLEFIGPGANAMILNARQENRYSPEKHEKRLDRIITHWPQIQEIVNELPSHQEIYDLMSGLGAPVSANSFQSTDDQVRTILTMTKDIRDKYVASQLLWDLGLLDEAAKVLP